MSFFDNTSSGISDFMRLFDMSVEALRSKETFYGTESKDRGPYERMSEETKQHIIGLGREGEMTCTQIARAVGKSQPCVYKVLLRAKVKAPGMGNGNRKVRA